MRDGEIYFSTPRGAVVWDKAVGWKIQWAPGFGPGFSRRFTRAQAIFAQEVARQMDRYIPLRFGTLKDSVGLGSDFERGLLTYTTPYARRQYYDRTLHHPKIGEDRYRGPYWGQQCDADHHPYFVSFAKKAVQKELKK